MSVTRDGDGADNGSCQTEVCGAVLVHAPLDKQHLDASQHPLPLPSHHLPIHTIYPSPKPILHLPPSMPSQTPKRPSIHPSQTPLNASQSVDSFSFLSSLSSSPHPPTQTNYSSASPPSSPQSTAPCSPDTPGRNRCTSLCLHHCGSGIGCSCLRPPGRDRSIRCKLCCGCISKMIEGGGKERGRGRGTFRSARLWRRSIGCRWRARRRAQRPWGCLFSTLCGGRVEDWGRGGRAIAMGAMW